jgi:hypothetical protein
VVVRVSPFGSLKDVDVDVMRATGSIWGFFSSIEVANLKAIDEEMILPYRAQ